MEIIKPKFTDYPGKIIELKSDDGDLDFVSAKDLAKKKARELYADPMLLSWYDGKTGEFYPKADCGPGDRPPWIVFAESRDADLTIDINAGEYVFVYLSAW